MAGECEDSILSAGFSDYTACYEYCLCGHRHGDTGSVLGILEKSVIREMPRDGIKEVT